MKRALGCLVIFGGVNLVSGINLQPGTAQDDANTAGPNFADRDGFRREVSAIVQNIYEQRDGGIVHNISTVLVVWQVMTWFVVFEDIYVRRYFRFSDRYILVLRICVALSIAVYLGCYFLLGVAFFDYVEEKLFPNYYKIILN